jgi:uncharacterized membrane protein
LLPLTPWAPRSKIDGEHMHPMWGSWGVWGIGMMLVMLVFWGVVSVGIVLGIRWMVTQCRESRPYRAVRAFKVALELHGTL